jgi:hypothetical protein
MSKMTDLHPQSSWLRSFNAIIILMKSFLWNKCCWHHTFNRRQVNKHQKRDFNVKINLVTQTKHIDLKDFMRNKWISIKSMISRSKETKHGNQTEESIIEMKFKNNVCIFFIENKFFRIADQFYCSNVSRNKKFHGNQKASSIFIDYQSFK